MDDVRRAELKDELLARLAAAEWSYASLPFEKVGLEPIWPRQWSPGALRDYVAGRLAGIDDERLIRVHQTRR